MVGFTKYITSHYLYFKSKISCFLLLCTHMKGFKKWRSGFKAAIKTQLIYPMVMQGLLSWTTSRSGQIDSPAAGTLQTLHKPSLQAKMPKEPGMIPDTNHEEGNTGVPCCRDICVEGEHNQNLYLCSLGTLGRQTSKRDPCSGATDHLKSRKQTLRWVSAVSFSRYGV